MGYVLFASRKVALTSRLNMLELELEMIQQQKQNLLDYSAAIADGVISSDEWAENTGCYNALGEFEISAYYGNTRNQERANAAIASAMGKYDEETAYDPNAALTQEEQEARAKAEMEFRQAAIEDIMADYANNVESKRIAAIENQLDMQMKKIETKITATQSELQSVEQAEGKAIENATPKYAGLG